MWLLLRNYLTTLFFHQIEALRGKQPQFPQQGTDIRNFSPQIKLGQIQILFYAVLRNLIWLRAFLEEKKLR